MGGVARKNLDNAGGILGTGAETVFVNDQPVALINNSTVAGPPNAGDVIVSGPAGTVFVESNQIAVSGAITAQGIAVGLGSPNVFAG